MLRLDAVLVDGFRVGLPLSPWSCVHSEAIRILRRLKLQVPGIAAISRSSLAPTAYGSLLNQHALIVTVGMRVDKRELIYHRFIVEDATIIAALKDGPYLRVEVLVIL